MTLSMEITGAQMPFLSHNQQCQNTEGKSYTTSTSSKLYYQYYYILSCKICHINSKSSAAG